jgi:hypothetical protein
MKKAVARTDESAARVNEATMLQHTDEIDIRTDDDPLREIARLLAAGILRLRCRAALLPPSASDPDQKKLPDSSLNCLD